MEFNRIDEAYEDALNGYIGYGKNRILSNREFCQLSMNGFVDWLYEHEIYSRAVPGVMKLLMTANKQALDFGAGSYRKLLDEALDKYIEINNQAIKREFEASHRERQAEHTIAVASF